MNLLGSIYKEQGDLTKALESYQESLRINKVCFGDDHFSIPSIVENIERVEQTIKEQHMLEFEFDSNSSKKSCCIVASVTKVIYDNPILNCEELMIEANKKGIRAIDILLDLSVDNEVVSQIIEASNEYGAEYVIDTLLGHVSDF